MVCGNKGLPQLAKSIIGSCKNINANATARLPARNNRNFSIMLHRRQEKKNAWLGKEANSRPVASLIDFNKPILPMKFRSSFDRCSKHGRRYLL